MIVLGLGLIGLYLGIAITAAGVLGIYRLPDTYTRLNALAKVTTTGAILVHVSSSLLLPTPGAKGILTALVLLLTTPVATHAIARTAHRLQVPSINHVDDLDEATAGDI